MNVVREKRRDAGGGSWDGMIADAGDGEVAAGPAALGGNDAIKMNMISMNPSLKDSSNSNILSCIESDNERGMVCLRTPDSVTILLMEELPREPGKGRV